VKKTALVAVLLSLAVLSLADSPSWPCWRGAGHDGVSTETGWDPLTLKDGARVLWKADVGAGYSDVAIRGGRLYTMGMDEEKCSVLCLDTATGKLIWRTSFPTHGEPMATPCVDGDRLYAVDNGGNVFCLRAADGVLLWKKSLMDELEVIVSYYGWASAPLVDGRLLLLNANRSGLALDKMTGETVWSSPNDYREWSARYGSYSSPVPLDFQGARCVLLYGPAALNLVESATGRILRTHAHGESLHPISDPIVMGSRASINRVVPALLDFTPEKPAAIWMDMALTTGITSAVLVDGYMYGCNYLGHSYPDLAWGALQKDTMPLCCVEWESGKVIWESDKRASTTMTASDGKLILLEHTGTLRIAEASPSGYHELASADVLAGEKKARRFVTAPVLCGGLIYCRNYAGDLVCVDVRRQGRE
jgi:hypothetical protein